MKQIRKTWCCILLLFHAFDAILCAPPLISPFLTLPTNTNPDLTLPFNLTFPETSLNDTLPLPTGPFSYPVPPPEKITVRFYSYGPPIHKNRALICLGAARADFLSNVDKYLHKPLNKPQEYNFRGVFLTIMSTGRSMTWAMDGATIRGVRFFIETYGAVGMLFDVQVETRSGDLAKVGTGRFTEIGPEVGGV